ncbi:hypothetical protein PISL3812_00199 [Talaromyces islandicus]|uniref:Uncharacterized protein n=1 Tax=Talaromyces islandicus TaxID=28573 RepID=A0A0U1LIL5_TALIS|nr:hypothetical protein PISL3812_00199 [Talaromyces islandicus]
MLIQTTSVTSGVSTFSILLIIGLIIRILRQRIFHPLRSVPGPLINSLSELPAALALVKGEQHHYYRSLHEQYGPVVRVSPNELSFIGTDAREEIYGFRKGGRLMEKSPIFLGAVGSVNGETGVSLALNKDHVRQRKALGYLFTNSALAKLEDIIQVHVHKFIAVLEKGESENQALNVSDWYTYLAFDIMGDLCFAEPFGCLDQASATEWSTSVINVFVAATWTQGIRRISGVGTYLERLMTWLLVPTTAASWRSIHLNNSRDETLNRLEDPNREHSDFMYHILKSESKNLLSKTEIQLNMALFISAGTDTTATALAGWTYFICTHPEVYKRLTTEIRDIFTDNADIKCGKVNELTYLEATLNEALRLYPPSPASQQRVVPPGGAVISGYFVPGGTTVAVPPWVSTHSPINFREPDAFRPTRWLGEDAEFLDDRLNASLPFGTGPRVCIGKNLANLEMKLIASKILWNFDVELDRSDHEAANRRWGLSGQMMPMKVFHSMTKPPLWIRLKRVNR